MGARQVEGVPEAGSLVEKLDALNRVAAVASRLGRQCVAPALTGFIAHTTGSFELAFTIAGVMLLLSIACYWLLIPKRSSDGLGESTKEVTVETVPS